MFRQAPTSMPSPFTAIHARSKEQRHRGAPQEASIGESAISRPAWLHVTHRGTMRVTDTNRPERLAK